MLTATFTLNIDPELHLGPLTLAWHGLTIAVGIGVGFVLAGRLVRRWGLSETVLQTMVMILAVSGLIGGRLFYVLEHGGPLLDTTGFTFDGGFILAAAALLAYVWKERRSPAYLDAIALCLPLGVAIGRLGDVINGEHYGPRSDGVFAVRNAHPDALTPDPQLAYLNGGLMEVVLALAVFAAIWLLRRWTRRPGELAWLVIALFSAGRFVEFFLRDDSPELALGLSNAQWTSLAMLVVALVGWRWTARPAGSGTQDPDGVPAS